MSAGWQSAGGQAVPAPPVQRPRNPGWSQRAGMHQQAQHTEWWPPLFRAAVSTRTTSEPGESTHQQTWPRPEAGKSTELETCRTPCPTQLPCAGLAPAVVPTRPAALLRSGAPGCRGFEQRPQSRAQRQTPGLLPRGPPDAVRPKLGPGYPVLRSLNGRHDGWQGQAGPGLSPNLVPVPRRTGPPRTSPEDQHDALPWAACPCEQHPGPQERSGWSEASTAGHLP